jgi:hypothetical protein
MEIITAYSDNYKKGIHTICGENKQLLNDKAGVT